MLIPPTSPLRNKWAAATVLALLLLILATCGYLKERTSRISYSVERDAALLESAGLKQALEVAPREVVKIVEKKIPVEVTKLIHEKVLVPVASAQIEGAPQPVTIPCPATGDITSVEVSTSLDGWFLLTRAPGGSLGYDGAWTVELARPGWSTTRTFDRTNTTVDLRVSDDITESLRAHEAEQRFTLAIRPISQWRTGWSTTAGIGVNPFDGQVYPTIAVGYSLQF